MESVEIIISAIGAIIGLLSALGYAGHRIVKTFNEVKNSAIYCNEAMNSITRFVKKYEAKFPKEDFKKDVIEPIDNLTESIANLAKLYNCVKLEKRLRDIIQ